LYSFFDFEKPYFEKYGLTTVAVGHPISDGLDKYKKTVKNAKIISFIPGSRMNEVKKLLPVFHETINMLGDKDYKFVMPTVETTDEYIRNNIQNWEIKPDLVQSDERYDLFANSYIAVAASGTVSAELAIMHIPTIVVYKMNPLTVLLAHLLVRIKWVSLVNILMNKTIFPELLGKNAAPEKIVNAIDKLTNVSERKKMIDALKKADNQWSRPGQNSAKLIACDILTAFK
jgi:lipid-A-disaccharide synthase